MLQLVTALKLITAVVIECAVVTLVTLSVVRRLLSDKKTANQSGNHYVSVIATDGFIAQKPQNRTCCSFLSWRSFDPGLCSCTGALVCSVCSCSCPSKQTS